MLNDHFSAFDLFKRKYTVILIDTGHFELKKKKKKKYVNIDYYQLKMAINLKNDYIYLKYDDKTLVITFPVMIFHITFPQK